MGNNQVLEYYDKIFLRVLYRAKRSWGGDWSTPFIAVLMLTFAEMVSIVTIISVAFYFGLDASTVLVSAFTIAVAAAFLFNIFRYGSLTRAERIEHEYDEGKFPRSEKILIDWALGSWVILAFLLMFSVAK